MSTKFDDSWVNSYIYKRGDLVRIKLDFTPIESRSKDPRAKDWTPAYYQARLEFNDTVMLVMHQAYTGDVLVFHPDHPYDEVESYTMMRRHVELVFTR